MIRLLRNLIGGSLIITGFFTMIGLSLYLLITGVIYLIQKGSTLSASDIAWEVVTILFRDVVSVVCGLLIILIGLMFIKRKKSNTKLKSMIEKLKKE
jgi:uncharacterized membrane protein YozB (DUF420 family)